MNKKGMLGTLILIVLIVFIIGTISNYYLNLYPNNKPICESKEYVKYELKECINNLKDIKICHTLNATWIKTEMYIISDTITCLKDGEIIRI